MKILHCAKNDITENSGHIYIRDRRQVHHLKNVLRLRLGERLVVCSGGQKYCGRICALSPERISMNIDTGEENRQDNRPLLAIACAVPKNARMDDIVDKLTQLGVARIIPLWTQRTIVRWNNQQTKRRLLRWQRIARSAAEQCGRPDLPKIDNVTPLRKILENEQLLNSHPLRLIPALCLGRRRGIWPYLNKTQNQIKKTMILIGPEGDWAPEEVALARQKRFIPVSLGDLVLRVDTAAVAVASLFSLCIISRG
ncbi:MAG: RsmE family RNA methyltransferase [Candidatus Omnitrophota bacterium]